MENLIKQVNITSNKLLQVHLQSRSYSKVKLYLNDEWDQFDTSEKDSK
jgi:hypothetical protein